LITKEQIQKLQESGIYKAALDWLNESPRTWGELIDHNLDWLMWDGYKTKLCPTETLDLYSHDNYRTKLIVARHPNISLSRLEVLSKEEHPHIRGRVAENENISDELALVLSKDSVPHVRRCIANNPFISTEIALSMVNDSDEYVRIFLAGKRKEKEILEILLNDSSEFVRNLASIKYDKNVSNT